MKFKESKLAHELLDGLQGLEIGGSAHNPFGLNTLNVDYTSSMKTIFKLAEIKYCGEAMEVDVVAFGDDIPVHDESCDFVINSHVIEHFYDPIKAIKEWKRIIKKGGYIFIIAPNRNALESDRGKPITTFTELKNRHESLKKETRNQHFTIFDASLLTKICMYAGLKVLAIQEPDDKVGNGITIVARKI